MRRRAAEAPSGTQAPSGAATDAPDGGDSSRATKDHPRRALSGHAEACGLGNGNSRFADDDVEILLKEAGMKVRPQRSQEPLVGHGTTRARSSASRRSQTGASSAGPALCLRLRRLGSGFPKKAGSPLSRAKVHASAARGWRRARSIPAAAIATSLSHRSGRSASRKLFLGMARASARRSPSSSRVWVVARIEAIATSAS